MTPPPITPPHDFELSNLETLGALCSKLVHDLKNKLAIISGNAQFFEMVKQDPQRTATIMSAIRRSSEEASKFIEQMAALRRDLSSHVVPSKTVDIVAAVEFVAQYLPGWKCQRQGEFPGDIVMPARWVAFAIWQVAQESRAHDGELSLALHTEIAPTDPSQITSGLLPGDYLKIVLLCAPPPPPPELPAGIVRPAINIRALAARELVGRGGGHWDERDLPDGRRETSLLLTIRQPLPLPLIAPP